MPKFSVETVARHIRKKHPGCPAFAVDFFGSLVSAKNWENASIGKAVGISMQNYLRYNMTDYEQHLRVGVPRDEARARVQPRIRAMLAVWQKPARQQPAAPPAIAPDGDG